MISDRLNRRENEVMNAVFTLSAGKERFLVSPYELSAVLPARGRYDEASLERTLNSLALDGYFDFVETDRKGEKTYVIHMRDAGRSYRRQDYQRKRSICFRWTVAALGAVITFLVGILLKLIFHANA